MDGRITSQNPSRPEKQTPELARHHSKNDRQGIHQVLPGTRSEACAKFNRVNEMAKKKSARPKSPAPGKSLRPVRAYALEGKPRARSKGGSTYRLPTGEREGLCVVPNRKRIPESFFPQQAISLKRS